MLLQDTHKRIFVYQFIFFVFIAYIIAVLTSNVMASLLRLDMTPSFQFLKTPSHIDIGESIVPVDNNSSFLSVIFAGFLNTISITVVAIFFSTFIGVFVALCRLSKNWLIKKIAIIYIEIIRNIPLMLLLLIWYRAFFLKLPGVKQSFIFGQRIAENGAKELMFSVSNRGLSMAWFKPTEHLMPWLYSLLAAFVLAAICLAYLKRRAFVTGKEQRTVLLPMGLFFLLALVSYLVLPNKALAAPKGQVEAAGALGLSRMKTMRLIVIPQAKVVIIPPLTSQFLGVAKNTSLGVAIGFPDMFAVTGTIINQTGRTLEMILLVMTVYLVLSLVTSFFMNQYNKKVQLKER